MPHSVPVAALSVRTRSDRAIFWLSQRRKNSSATMPTMRRTMPTVTIAAVAQPMAMPSMPPGRVLRSVVRSKVPRQVHSDTPSMTTRIGSRIAAACTGDTTNDISGTPISAIAPPKPPFDMPMRITAGTAAAKNSGSERSDVIGGSLRSTRIFRRWRGRCGWIRVLGVAVGPPVQRVSIGLCRIPTNFSRQSRLQLVSGTP